jgi:hypothetical protein
VWRGVDAARGDRILQALVQAGSWKILLHSWELGNGDPALSFHEGNVEKSRQRRSRHFAVLTYSMYAPRVKMAAVLLDGLF